MVSSLGHKLVSSASVAGRLGAIAGPVSYQTTSCRTSCALFVAIDAGLKYWFADALGSIAFRPLSTLYYAGVEMDADIPLGFTVKIFTAGSLVGKFNDYREAAQIRRYDRRPRRWCANWSIYSSDWAHCSSMHSHESLDATKEVQMMLNNKAA